MANGKHLDTVLRHWSGVAAELKSRPDAADAILDAVGGHEVYRLRVIAPEGRWRAGESWCLTLCLSMEEAQARAAGLPHPDRRQNDLYRLPNLQHEILPILVDQLRRDADGEQALLERLAHFTPYDFDALLAETPGGEWLWYVHIHHYHLRLFEGRVRFPAEFPVDRIFTRIGPLEGQRGHLHLANAAGRVGLCDVDGRLVLPCHYRWLGNIGFGTQLLEAQRPGDAPDESDLIDLAGQRINPPGVKLLAGSFDTCGQAVVIAEGTGESGRKGLMANDGKLLGERRWRWIGAPNEGLATVQDTESGLWGYLDAGGAPAIPCQFREAWAFSGGRAVAVPVADADAAQTLGIIDPQGHWAIPPVWKDLASLRQHFIVEDFAGRYGVLDRDGRALLEPRRLSDEERGDGADIDPWYDIRYTLQRALSTHARNRIPRERIEADPQHSLAGVANFFDAQSDQRDLINTGLWGMRVRISENREWNGRRFEKGDTGTIFWQYPVSAGLFDLGLEAPVMGLFGRENPCLGVPWDLLCAETAASAP